MHNDMYTALCIIYPVYIQDLQKFVTYPLLGSGHQGSREGSPGQTGKRKQGERQAMGRNWGQGQRDQASPRLPKSVLGSSQSGVRIGEK